jgi:hypothetical protein
LESHISAIAQLLREYLRSLLLVKHSLGAIVILDRCYSCGSKTWVVVGHTSQMPQIHRALSLLTVTLAVAVRGQGSEQSNMERAKLMSTL